MSELEKLIEKLCPNGVEYRKLEDLCMITRGRVMSKDYIRNNIGNYPVYSSQTENNGQLGKIATYDFDGEYLTWTTDGAHAGAVFYRNGKFSVTNVCGLLKVTSKNITTKFLYYTLSIEALKYVNAGMGNPKLMSNIVAKIKIPLPPLEVQNEIVRILDKFTELTTELTAELTTELTARRKQYEYYRDNLIKKFSNVKKIKFGDIAKIQRGASPRPIDHFLTNDEGGINWIKIGDVKEGKKYIDCCKEKITIEGSKKSKLVKKGDFILSNSMSFGRPYILAIDGCIHDGWLYISDFHEYFVTDFLYHLLNSSVIQNEFKQRASFGGAVQNLNANIVREVKLPIVSKDDQREIVKLLDKFENYCNDISEGLPAEIEARKKQYEYYRDKLLNFKKLECDN